MARRSRRPAPFPSRDAILRFVEERRGEVGKREIARAFGLKGAQREELKRVLRGLADEGLVARGRKRRVAKPGALPHVAVIDVVDVDVDGELLARPHVWRYEEEPPRIVVVAPARGPRVVNLRALAVGDRLLARLSRSATEDLYEARPVRILESAPGRVIGVFRESGGIARIHPTDRRAKKDYTVAPDATKGARSGELVLAETLPGVRLGLPRARIVERLGALDAPRAISLIAIHTHGIPTLFSAEALEEAARAEVPALGARADLRRIPLVTIDGADARDFDDAVWAEADPDPKNPGGFRILVAIADVAHYVRPGGALDRAAEERGNSAYFPDRVVPMLPEALSNGLCSLKPGEDRACLAVEIALDREGNRLGHRFMRGLMRSAARLTYEAVQACHDGRPGELSDALRENAIMPLYAAYRALRAERERRGALDIELPEPRVVIGEDGGVAAVEIPPHLDSHRLIEEFMIAANVSAAETLERAGVACMYRIHARPAAAKLDALREFLATLGLKLSRAKDILPRHFNQILAKVRGTPNEHLVNTVTLRAQAKAEYAPENIGHFGLGLARYCHFTSPIRRYADVLVHRALIAALKLGEGGLPRDAGRRFARLGAHISETERRAEAAERDATERYMTAYLAERVGATFDARISGVTRFGLFVSLEETGAEGLIPMRTLGGERFAFDEANHTLRGRRTVYRLGDLLKVRLAEADRITGAMVFEPADRPAGVARRPGTHGRRRGR